jgi:hypothetical protein
MKALRRSGRLIRLAGCAALTLGLAAAPLAGSLSAHARVTPGRHAVVSGGANHAAPQP